MNFLNENPCQAVAARKGMQSLGNAPHKPFALRPAHSLKTLNKLKFLINVAQVTFFGPEFFEVKAGACFVHVSMDLKMERRAASDIFWSYALHRRKHRK